MSTFSTLNIFKDEEFEGNIYKLAYDSENNLIGVVAIVIEQGFSDEITYKLVIDRNGQIIRINIISHSETAGIGDVIVKPDFLDRFIGKGYKDPLQDDVDIDKVTGATISTKTMIDSIRQVVQIVSINYLGFDNEVDLAAVPDGTYLGTGAGMRETLLWK